MKKIKRVWLIAVVFCSLIMFAACGNNDLKITSTITERTIPDSGYTERTISGVSMYVPDAWTYFEYGSIPMYISDAFGSSSSVNVVTQNETANLKKAKKSDYQEMLGSVYTNLDIQTFTLVNFCGDTMLYMKLSIIQSGQTFNMWQFMVSKSESTRAVTITLLPDAPTEIADVIYNSLVFN